MAAPSRLLHVDIPTVSRTRQIPCRTDLIRGSAAVAQTVGTGASDPLTSAPARVGSLNAGTLPEKPIRVVRCGTGTAVCRSRKPSQSG
jgi:hypothetical protein